MTSPSSTLLVLCAIATAIGLLCWREHEWRIRTADAEAATRSAKEDSGEAVNRISRLETQLAELKAQVTALKAENTSLQDRLKQALEANKPPPTPDSIARQLAQLRELPFRRMPEWVPASLETITEQIRSRIASGMPEASAKARARAAVALGLHPNAEEFDIRAGIASLEQMRSGGFYDEATNRFYYQEQASLNRADSREVFAGGLLPVLLAQNFAVAARDYLDTPNDDAARAAEALARGDANITRVKFSIGDSLNLNFGQTGAPPEPVPTYDAPVYLAEAWKFTHDRGSLFVEELQAAGGLQAVNQAYNRPPRSTAEILHPELYLANPPFTPLEISLPEEAVAGIRPLHSNVAGELSIYTILRAHCDVDFSTQAAEGWHGDRYLVFPGSDEYGDHLFWKTVWVTEKDAGEFFQAMRRILMQRYSIPWQEKYDAVPGRFDVTDPHRVIRLVHAADGKTVTLLNATSPEFAAALEAASSGW